MMKSRRPTRWGIGVVLLWGLALAAARGEDHPCLIGYRGCYGVPRQPPENSVPAVDWAYDEFGLDGVEMDILRTRDGVIVIHHDATIDRTTDGQGLLSDYTLAELAQFTLGTWRGVPVRIPTLEAVLERNGRRGWFFVDAKGDLGECIPGIREAIRRSGCPESFLHFTLFDLATACAYKRAFPASKVSYKTYAAPNELPRELVDDVASAGVDGIMFPIYPILPSQELIEYIHAQGLLITGFVHYGDLASLQQLVDLRIDFILTNQGEWKPRVSWRSSAEMGWHRLEIAVPNSATGKSVAVDAPSGRAWRFAKSSDLRRWTRAYGRVVPSPRWLFVDAEPSPERGFYRLNVLSREPGVGE